MKSQLKQLKAQQPGQALTMILPTEPSDKGKNGGLPEVERLQEEAAQALEQAGVQDPAAHTTALADLYQQIEWKKLSQSLGFFIAPGFQQLVYLPLRKEHYVHVAKAFTVEELLRELNRLENYSVIVLSPKKTRAFEGFRDGLVEMRLPNLPKGFESKNKVLDKALAEDRHIANRMRSAAEQEESRKVSNYLRQVDEVIGEQMNQTDRKAVIVGVEPYLGRLKEMSENLDKIIAFVNGSYDYASAEDVAKLVWPVVQQKISMEQAYIDFELEAAQEQQLLASGFQAVWEAANDGRARKLVIDQALLSPEQMNNHSPVTSDNGEEDGTSVKPLTMDHVDQLIDMVLEQGGSLLQMNPGQLEQYNGVALVMEEDYSMY